MKIIIWPILLDRKCARQHEKINKGLDKCHRKSVLSMVEGLHQSRLSHNACRRHLALTKVATGSYIISHESRWFKGSKK